ncbi:MAG: hypothetical protein SGPRY_010527, partial [Prymnesium sp.]
VTKPSAPPFEFADHCAACLAEHAHDASFGLTRSRHHCRHCGRSHCAHHLRWRCPLPKFQGLETPQRVCKQCVMLLAQEEAHNRNVHRLARASEYIAGVLPPYKEVIDDTVAAKARRLGEAGLQIAKSLPLSGRALAAIHSIDAVRKFGRLGFAGVLLKVRLQSTPFHRSPSRPP